MGGWEALEKQVIAAGEKVKTLKTGGGEKEAVDAAVADLLSLKTAFTAALEEAIAAAPDEAAKEALRAKVPPAPKPSKRDKKADKATAKGDAPADADKAANIKAAEELKAAARAKKKAEAEAKAGAPPPAPKQPPSAQPAAAAPPAQKPTTTNVAVRKPGEPLTRDVIVAAIGKVLFLKLSKEDAQQLYKEAGTKPDWNVVARYTRQCLRSKESAASISSHFVSALSILNEVLEPQMFLSGGASPCVADIACYVALIACMQAFSASPPHTQALCNVTRWFDYLQHTIDALHPPDALGAACKVRACGLRVSLALATPSATHAFTTVLFTSARSSLGLASQVSFNLEMPDSEVERRVLSRRLCSGCGLDYNLIASRPAVEDICDVCRGALVRRTDDQPEALANRLRDYHDKTRPVIDLFERKEFVVHIDATQSRDAVYENVCEGLALGS